MLGTTLYIGYRGLIQVDLNENKLLINSLDRNQENIEYNKLKINHSPISLNNSVYNTENKHITNIEDSNNIKKYIGSTLNDKQKIVLLEKLEKIIQYDKIFINEKLSLDDVAVRLNTNTNYISQIINETYNKNFYNFINSYRVEEAKKLLTIAENEKFSILGIAQSVGFVSKSAFNVAFKRVTGLTPSEYKKSAISEIKE
jgi:AraC-like DNA-binding protein